ncbi:MAG: hypothetical protein HUU29_11375 [Planctomycetaceae bacterium]|nr:hypothetical protein [Planctomycetaceae bacterium]
MTYKALLLRGSGIVLCLTLASGVSPLFSKSDGPPAAKKLSLKPASISRLIQSAYTPDYLIHDDRSIVIDDVKIAFQTTKTGCDIVIPDTEADDGKGGTTTIPGKRHSVSASRGATVKFKIKGRDIAFAVYPDRLDRLHYFPANAVQATLGKTPVTFVDANFNGVYFDEGIDHVIVGKAGQYAFPFYKTIAMPDFIYVFEVGDKDVTVTPQEYTTKDLAREVQMTLNKVRIDFGLVPVVSDPEWDVHCHNHSEYMRLNTRRTHDEQPGLEGYTAKGHEAGVASNLSFKKEAGDAVYDLWDTPLHGYRMRASWYAKGAFGAVPGYTTIMVRSLEQPATPMLKPYVFPPNNSVNIPVDWRDEDPDPRVKNDAGNGYPITYYVIGWDHGDIPESMSVTLEAQAKKTWTNVDVQVTYSAATGPSNVFSGMLVPIYVLPINALNPNTLYRLTAKFKLKGKEYNEVSCFTTGTGKGQQVWDTTQQ